MISIDVEAQPARAESAHIDRLIWGRFGNAESGLAQMMASAERNGARVTTYFDYAEQYLYGDSMVDVAREIHRRGHDLQLHLHPEFLSDDFFKKRGTGRVHGLTEVKPADAKILAEFLVNAQTEVTGRQALAFRGGGYRFNHSLLRALYEEGVRVDSSYNPSRPTQPVNVGFHKQFRWQDSTFEVPVSNVFGFSNPEHHLDYNFNSQALWGKSPEDSVARHRRYLDLFYATYGDDALAVLVLHSWSLLQRDDAGHYQHTGSAGLERFDALLESLKGYASIVDTDGALALMRGGGLGPSRDLAAAEASRDARGLTTGRQPSGDAAPAFPGIATPSGLATSRSGPPACPICGTPVSDFEDFNGPRRRCKGCGAVERQRAFAELYRGELGRRHPLRGKKVLLIAPSSSEKRFLKELGAQVVTADIRPEVKPDILTDVCDMANVAAESFDVVIASYVLTCVHSLELALSELKRVLRPGGLLLTSDPITRGRATREHTDEKTITDWYGKEAYEKYRVGSFRSFGDEDALALVGRFLRCESQATTDVANGSEVIWLVSHKEPASPSLPANSNAAISRQTLRIAGCTVCGDHLQRVEAQQNCPSCQSRARLRALVPVLAEVSIRGVSSEATLGAARLTQINATDAGELVWGSDDKLGIGKSVLMAMQLQAGVAAFRHLGFAGPNAVRNVIKLGPSLFMFLCETKEPANEAAECVVMDVATGTRVTLALPNLTGQNSTSTDSLGSTCLRDGVGFLPAIGAILTTSKNGILRLRFQDGEAPRQYPAIVSPTHDGSATLMSLASVIPSAATPPPTGLTTTPSALAPSMARAPLSRPCFSCDPQREYGLTGPTRVCFWDQTRKEFARLCELKAGEVLDIPLADLSDTFDLKVKVQVRGERTWVDKIGYRRVEVDAESLQGIRYRYFPRAGTRHLVVIFQAMNTSPGYNYLGTLKDVPASRLYIKDDYGEDSQTRSSYYLGARRSFDVSEGVRSLVGEALMDLGLRPRDLVMGGSSKGAFAALFHGYGLNAGHVVAGGPQVRLGTFLNSRSPTSVLPPILRYLAGDTSPESVAWSDNVLFEQIAASSPPYPQVTIHVGAREPHYHEHVRPLLDWLAQKGLPPPSLDLGDYTLHSDLDVHFPAFFRAKVDSLVRGG